VQLAAYVYHSVGSVVSGMELARGTNIACAIWVGKSLGKRPLGIYCRA
jgi:hypothetical protein